MPSQKELIITYIFLVFTIIFLTLGIFVLPTFAATDPCPPFEPQTMIKVVGSPAIYVLNVSRQALYFPSGDEFKSWHPAYGGYTLVSQACFESIGIPNTYPGGVNFHPGSVVVKRPNSNQLYVVEPGNTLAKTSSSSARIFYGQNFKTAIVGDQFWQNYINRGTDVTTKPHPGMLIKIGAKIFYINDENTIREVTDAGFIANGFQSIFVHVGVDSWLTNFAVGAKIDSEIKSFTDMTQTSSTSTTTTPTLQVPSSGGSGASSPAGATSFDRDQLRISNLQTIGAALGSYFAEAGNYPTGNNVVLGIDTMTCLNSDGWNLAEDCPYPYLANIPHDPQNGAYVYSAVIGNNNLAVSYEVDAMLEGVFNSWHGPIKLTPEGIFNR